MEEHVKNILALAWASFDTPLWHARKEMQEYLEKHFELKKVATAADAAEGWNGRMPKYF
jgi:hypothetical protein